MSEHDEEYERGWSNPPSRLDSGPASWLGAPDPVESFGQTVEQALRNLSIELAGLRAERDGMRLELEGLRTQLELTQQRLSDRDQFAATVRELGKIAQRLQPPGGWSNPAVAQYAPPQPQPQQYAPPQYAPPQYAPPPAPAPPPAAPYVDPTPPPYAAPVVHAPQVVAPVPDPAAYAPPAAPPAPEPEPVAYVAPEPVAYIPPAPEPPAPEPVAYIPPAPAPEPVTPEPIAQVLPTPEPVVAPEPEAPAPEPVAFVPEPPAPETARFVMPPASAPITEPAPVDPTPTPSERAFEPVSFRSDRADAGAGPGSALEAPSDNFFDQPGVWIGPPVKDEKRKRSLGTWGRRVGTGILSIVVVVVLLISVGPKVLPYQTYFVRSGSMSPTFNTGDMIFLTKTDAADIKERDIITFERPDQPGTLVTHRVTAIESGAEGRQFQTKGDANNEIDSWRVPATGTGWKYKFRVAKLGYVFGYLGSPAARLALLAVPAVLLGVLSLIDIWKPQQPKARRKR